MRPARLMPATALVALLLLAGCAVDGSQGGYAAPAVQDEEPIASVVVHKSPTCDCCGGHEDYLEARGFAVESEVHEQDLADWKDAQGIPRGHWSCHTTVVGGYLVEGHVPAETIVKLLEEQPEIDGITLPGMPAGSPGMGGVQDEPWVIEMFVDGEVVGVFDIR
jgi:hypothetical protein